MNKFVVGKKYKRSEVLDLIGVPASPSGNPHRGGVYSNGYFKFEHAYYIFTNIGVSGRTGHDYRNRFLADDTLFWFANTRSRLEQNQIQALINPNTQVYIFYRENNLDAFTYAGMGRAVSYQDTSPVQITWQILKPAIAYQDLGQPLSEQVLSAGKAHYSLTKQFERNPQARQACVEHYGYDCVICGFNFAKTYGVLGEKFIHVHHITPLSAINAEYVVDPIQDLRPVCPNCHAMIHRTNEPLSIQALQAILVKPNF